MTHFPLAGCAEGGGAWSALSAVRDRVAGPAGAAMAVFAWNYHVLVRRHPGPGGAFAYAYDVLGPDYGFLVGWSLLLAYMAVLWANATALVLLVPKYLSGGALAAESYLMLALWAVLGFAVYRSVFKRERDRFGRTMAVWLGAMVLVFFSSLMWVRQVSTRAIRGDVDAIARFYHAQYRRLTGSDSFVSVLDGAEALEKLRAPGPRPFDLLVTDLQMPGMGGAELVQTIRADPARDWGCCRASKSGRVDFCPTTRAKKRTNI